MLLLSLQDINLDLGTKTLFSGLSCSFSLGDRIGLVGLNGSGKSTLLNMLRERIQPDSGRIWLYPGVKISHVSQFLPDEFRTKTLFDLIAENIPDGYLGKCPDYLVESAIEQVHLAEELLFSSVGSLSGGEVNRALLARALVSEPDVLLLDEPTNHLDVDMVQEFEAVFSKLKTQVICLISHDRELLDRLTHKTYFLRDHKITALEMPYSQARAFLAKSDDDAKRRRESEEREIGRVRASAKRLAEWGKVFDNEKFSKRAKSMQKRVERMEEELSTVTARSRATVNLETAQPSSPSVLSLEAGKVVLPNNTCLFRFPEIYLRSGQRMLLHGANGCGKSTFLRQLVGQLRTPVGAVLFNCRKSVSIGYYDQELRDFDFSCTVFDFIRQRSNLGDQEIINELVRAGFPYIRQRMKIEVLSGGERARLKLLLLKIERPTLLILDEPTNHLDVDGIEQLEHALVENNTTCLFVSHDRRFVKNVATCMGVIENGVLKIELVTQL